MADAVTAMCASAAAAAANACGLPTDASILAALGGAAVSVWLQHGDEAELVPRWLTRAVMHGGMAAGVGLSAGPAVPLLWPSLQLLPAWVPVFVSSLAAHWLVALAGRTLGRLGGSPPPADGSEK